MKLVRSVLILAAAGLLSACQTMTPEERRAADEAKCVDYGFRQRTDAFAECLQRLELDRRAESRAASIRASRMTWYPPVVYRTVVVRK